MEFEMPAEKGFTIYSKSGCPNCSKVKDLIKENKFIFNVIDCDEYLLEEKEQFLSFIEKISGKPCKVFPIVFFNNEFIGGYNETKNYIVNMFLEFEETFTF